MVQYYADVKQNLNPNFSANDRRDLGDEILLASIHMQSSEKSFEPLPYKKYDTMKLEYHFERWKN